MALSLSLDTVIGEQWTRAFWWSSSVLQLARVIAQSKPRFAFLYEPLLQS